MACNVPTLLVAYPLGRAADRWGRRPVLLLCCATQTFGSAGMLLVCLLQLDLLWMIPPYIVNGMGGGSYVLQSVLMASLVDASGPGQAPVLLAWATATYYFCGCVGPVVGGYLESPSLVLLPEWHGRQYQLPYLLFFATNVLLLFF